MDYTIIVAIVGAIQTVAVAIISGLFYRESKNRKAHNDKMEKRSAIRAKESQLSMKLMSASASLSVATALAIKDGSVNGKMDAALESVTQAQRDYYDFVNKVASEQLSEN